MKNCLDIELFHNAKEEILDTLLENIKHPIFFIKDKKVIFANDSFLNLIEQKDINSINTKYDYICDIFHLEDKLHYIKSSFKKVSLETKKNKKKYYLLNKIYIEHLDTEIVILYNISHKIKHKEELNKALYTDSLTNLPNRINLINKLQQGIKDLDSIAIVDINSFKEINDFYGHKIGDRLLKDVGDCINQVIVKHKALELYKFPSDTYCITNNSLSKEKFTDIIKYINEMIYNKVFYIDNQEIDVKITTGLSFSKKNNKLITANIALQTAKKDNKDYFIFYDQLDKFQEYEYNMLWTKKLKTALLNDNIEVFFQPIINNNTKKIEKYECLIRLIDYDGKIISPFFFLDISKKSNQYKKLTRIVIEKSFKTFEHLDFEFSINISYEDIESPTFIPFIKEMLQKYDVSHRVVFEILEDEHIKNYNNLISFINDIKKLGCKVAIDDFGSGYSNFEQLLKMNVDYLKIDASLIKNIAIDKTSYKITKTIVEFAKSLNVKTIAEFVESKEIYNIAYNLGINYSQGYYFSEPIKEPKR